MEETAVEAEEVLPVWRPLNIHFARESDESLRSWLDARKPERLGYLFNEGVSAARREWAEFLSRASHRKLESFGRQAQVDLKALQSRWDALDRYERFGVFEAAAAGYFSEETAVGTAIGDLIMPGIGSIIGGAIGGWFAGAKVDEEAKKAQNSVAEGLERVLLQCETTFDVDVFPLIQRDAEEFERLAAQGKAPGARSRKPLWVVILAVVGALFVLALAAVGAWFLFDMQATGQTPWSVPPLFQR